MPIPAASEPENRPERSFPNKEGARGGGKGEGAEGEEAENLRRDGRGRPRSKGFPGGQGSGEAGQERIEGAGQRIGEAGEGGKGGRARGEED